MGNFNARFFNSYELGILFLLFKCLLVFTVFNFILSLPFSKLVSYSFKYLFLFLAVFFCTCF